MEIVLYCLIALGFISIVIEDIVHIDKAKTTLFFGSLVWIIYFIGSHHGANQVQIALNENLLEIASLWLFLMAAMTFVAYLSHKGTISILVNRLLPNNLTERKLMFLTGIFAFVFSSFADNITSTLVCISLLTGLNLERKKLLRFLVLIIFAVNAGGAALITGDVTTLMIFLAGKVEIQHLFLLILPSFIAVLVLASLLSLKMKDKLILEKSNIPIETGDKVVAMFFGLTIIGTLTGSILFSLPPVLCFLFGLSLMFLVVQFINHDEPVLDYIRKIEFDTLLFFLGVLLLVGMLKELQVLNYVPKLYEVLPVDLANYAVGIASSLFDNVPLTAALLKSDIHMNLAQWLTLTYSVGVGGSLLIIGSAAGVVAMSKVQELTFGSYLRYFLILLFAFTIGFAGVVAIGSLL